MQLLGRDEEILYFNREFANPNGFANLVFGLSGVGKSYLVKHWSRVQCTKNCLVSHHKCADPTQVPQYFIKTLSSNLISSLSVEEHNLFLFSLRESIGQNFPINEWCQASNQDYLKDGYIFIQILRALVVSLNKSILLIIDQAEKLSEESLYLLKQIVEWKPTSISIVTCVTSKFLGKEGFEKEFAEKFYFKGQTTIELKAISSIFQDSYFELYGISQEVEGLHFQECALYQKRLWLMEQLTINQEMQEAFLHLAKFPDGLQESENFYFEYFYTLLDSLPILDEILHLEGTLIRFDDDVYAQDILEKFTDSKFCSIQNTKHKDLIRYHLYFDLQSNPCPSEEVFLKLLKTYMKCLDFSNLNQLSSAFDQESVYSEHTQKYSKACSLVSNLYFNYSDQLFEEYLDYSQTLDKSIKKDMSQNIYHLLKVHNKEVLFYKHFISTDTLDSDSNFLKQVIWAYALNMKQTDFEVFECFADLIHENFYAGSVKVCNYFLSENKIHSKEELPQEYQTEAFYILGLASMENSNFVEAKQYFIKAVHQSLLDQDFDHLSSILSSVSEVCTELNDFESQLENYREAVIVDQFSL
ncbi:MAG: ATP-binding protein [Candidatus Cloacimonetes bacterium]|nr:ATP-binding protein [Candidatus Cloacimonadota bacterium]